MQKNAQRGTVLSVPARRMLLYMKVSALFLLMALQVSAINYGQSTITLTVSDITLTDVLKKIEQTTRYRFSYSNDIIPTDKIVSVNAVNASIDEVLFKLLEGHSLSWKVVKQKNVVISSIKDVIFSKPEAKVKIITGTITDDKGQPINGASVVIKGSTIGATTATDGSFSINANSGDVLVITSVGFASQEVRVGTTETLTITLIPLDNKLEEVVVVGYGTQKRINLTGSVATVSNKMVEGRPMTNISAGLAGLLPGVYARQSTGLPGGDGATIRVRGVGTLNNASPMVLVDGIESSMNDINPEDIASISVLKDAASAAIYGSKAANGVILITTKTGKKGKPVVTLSTNFGKQTATRLPEYLGSADYAILYNEALKYAGQPAKFTEDDIKKFRDGSDPYGHPNTDWLGLLYAGKGLQTINTLSVSGGGDYVNYMASVNYLNQQGIIKYTGKKQYGGRANITITPNKWLQTGFNVSFTREAQEQPNNIYVGGGLDQIIRQANRIAPWIPYKNQDGTYGTISDGNPIAWIDQGPQINRLRNFFFGIGSITIKPFDGFSLKGVASIKTFTEDKSEYNKEIQYNPNKYQGPTNLKQTNTADERQVGELIANYNKDFNNHNIGVMAGFHGELYKYKTTNAYRQNFPNSDLTDIDGGATDGMKNGGYTRELAMLSYFGRINYAYMGKYLAEFNIRRDGSSRFQPQKRWGNFPSVSVGWRISQENFFEPLKDVVNDLKIRASWGKLGNQDALSADNTNNYYPTIPVLALGKDYPFNSKIVSGAAIVNAANTLLSWEEATTKGIGIDISLFRKLNLNIDYYDRLTSAIIMVIPSPETFALKDFIDNVGKMSNRGIEVNAQYNDKFGNIGFSFGGNLAYNKNKIQELAGQSEILNGLYIRRVGQPFDAFYGYKTDGIFKTDAEATAAVPNNLYNAGTFKAGDLRYIDSNGDGKINGNDRVILGNSVPTVNFGFNLGATYRQFDFLAIFNGTLGGYGYMNADAIGGLNGDAQKPAALWLQRWTPENANATVPRVKTGITGPNLPQNNVLSYWLRSSNYLRLKNIQLGYNFANGFLKSKGISNARIYISSQNTFTITKFLKGWDPEAPSGRGSGYPVVMVNAVGLNVSF